MKTDKFLVHGSVCSSAMLRCKTWKVSRRAIRLWCKASPASVDKKAACFFLRCLILFFFDDASFKTNQRLISNPIIDILSISSLIAQNWQSIHELAILDVIPYSLMAINWPISSIKTNPLIKCSSLIAQNWSVSSFWQILIFTIFHQPWFPWNKEMSRKLNHHLGRFSRVRSLPYKFYRFTPPLGSSVPFPTAP